MTIKTIPRRLPEVGRLRLGEKRASRNGQTHPATLAAWRLTSKSRYRLDAAAKVYGGTVRPWTDAPGEDDQFELYTDAKALRVCVVASYDSEGRPIAPYSQFYEFWSAGGNQRRCDGRTEFHSGEPCLCAMECEIPAEYKCDPITRFNVLLPDLPGLGVWRCESHGYYAATELPGTIDLLASLGRPVPVALLIDQRSEKRPGQPRRDYVVPILDSRQSFLDLQMLAAADPMTGELPAEPAPLEAPEEITKTAGSGSTPQDPGSAPPSEAGPAGGGGRDGPTGRGPASDTTSPTARGGISRTTGPREPAGSGAATPGSTPDPKSPPTPSQEAPLSRGGVEGANVPPGSQAPPGPGGTTRAGRGGNLGKAAPADTDPEQASLAVWERQHADDRDPGWWTQ